MTRKKHKNVKHEINDEEALNNVFGEEGLRAGRAIGNKFFAPGSLGHVDPNLSNSPYSSDSNLAQTRAMAAMYGQRDPMQGDVLNRMKSGLEGYTAPEYQAQREQMERGLNSQFATASSQLAKAQAQGKVYGAAGAAQRANLIQGTSDKKNELEQDLYIKNIDEKQKRLGEYGQYGQNLAQGEYTRESGALAAQGEEEARLRKEQMDAEKYNQAQDAAALAARFSALTGTAGMYQQQTQNKEANKISREGIDAINANGSKARRKTPVPA